MLGKPKLKKDKELYEYLKGQFEDRQKLLLSTKEILYIRYLQGEANTFRSLMKLVKPNSGTRHTDLP